MILCQTVNICQRSRLSSHTLVQVQPLTGALVRLLTSCLRLKTGDHVLLLPWWCGEHREDIFTCVSLRSLTSLYLLNQCVRSRDILSLRCRQKQQGLALVGDGPPHPCSAVLWLKTDWSWEQRSSLSGVWLHRWRLASQIIFNPAVFDCACEDDTWLRLSPQFSCDYVGTTCLCWEDALLDRFSKHPDLSPQSGTNKKYILGKQLLSARCFAKTRTVCVSFRGGRHRGMLWKSAAALTVGAVCVQYAASDARERRRKRIMIEGFGRFCRLL